MAINKAFIQAILGSDPETGFIPSGLNYTRLSVAHTKKTKNKKYTYWITIIAWGKIADVCVKYLKKGTEAIFEGQLTTSEYTKDGKKHTKFEFLLDQLHFLPRPAPKDEPEDDLPF